MTRYRLRVIKGRRPDDPDAEARMRDVVGDLCGLGEDTVQFLPPSVQVGWLAAGDLAFCLTCAPEYPQPSCTAIYRESYHATKPCVVCGRRLEESPV